MISLMNDHRNGHLNKMAIKLPKLNSTHQRQQWCGIHAYMAGMIDCISLHFLESPYSFPSTRSKVVIFLQIYGEHRNTVFCGGSISFVTLDQHRSFISDTSPGFLSFPESVDCQNYLPQINPKYRSARSFEVKMKYLGRTKY